MNHITKICIDSNTHKVYRGEKCVELTPMRFMIFRHLWETSIKKKKYLEYAALEKHVYSDTNRRLPNTNSMAKVVSLLRKDLIPLGIEILFNGSVVKNQWTDHYWSNGRFSHKRVRKGYIIYVNGTVPNPASTEKLAA
jgi:hypothetical protein